MAWSVSGSMDMAIKASTGRVRLVYKFIELHKHQYPVQVRCELLKLLRAGTASHFILALVALSLGL